jgi:hypothetical protein
MTDFFSAVKTFLGADDGGEANRIALYFPNKGNDEDGEEISIDNSEYRTEMRATLAEIFGGSTTFVDLDGYFYDRDSGEFTDERTSLIYSFGSLEEWERNKARIVREFYNFGRDTRQKSLFMEVFGYYFFIEIGAVESFLANSAGRKTTFEEENL